MIETNILKTRNPKDFKKIINYAIEQTKVQSLKDIGVELLPNDDKEWGEQRFYIAEGLLAWDDCSYAKSHLNTNELATDIAKKFPNIEFELWRYCDSAPGEYYGWLWDGNEWVEMKELVVGFLLNSEDERDAKSDFQRFVSNHLRTNCSTSQLRLIEVLDGDTPFVRCQFAADVTEKVYQHIENFLKNLNRPLYGIIVEYQSVGESLLKKVEATKNGNQWTEATEEEQLNFNGEVTAEEVRKHHRDSYDFAKKLKFY
jgi:hypothetical protein